MTRKQQHAEGISFLEKAVYYVDQADSCFLDAKTRDCVEGSTWGTRVSSRCLAPLLEDALKSARQATCDDCGKLIAECNCGWSNERAF